MVNLTADSATSALGTEMLNDAHAEVDKYLSRRYDLSTAFFQTAASTPPVVRKITLRLAEGYMWGATSRGAKESLARSKALIDGEMTNLQDIADYKVDLVNSAGSLIPDMDKTSYRILCNTTDYSNTFNEDSPTSWASSGRKADDIESERDE